MHSLQKLLLIHLLMCFGQLVQGSDIIHGKKAPKGSMLYMVSVQNNTGHVCGGSLIAENFVLTAAHCFYESFGALSHVVVGTHNLMNGAGETIKIITKFIYNSYNNIEQGDDIMLLKLERKAKLGQTIQLPHAEINLKGTQECQVAGWGATETATEVHELRVVNVSIINPQICQDQWHHKLPPNVTCAGGYNTEKGFCQGDSGGPLVCNGLAVGVASHNKHRNCTYPNVPNVYTDVSKYFQWINTTVTRPKHFE